MSMRGAGGEVAQPADQLGGAVSGWCSARWRRLLLSPPREPHTGQWVGKTKALSWPVRFDSITFTISGITSPARRTKTQSPTRTSLRSSSSSLCSVARETVTPPTKTGFRCGHRGQRAGAADLDHDVLHLRLHLLGRELVGDRPARALRDLAEARAQRPRGRPSPPGRRPRRAGAWRSASIVWYACAHAVQPLRGVAPRVDRQAPPSRGTPASRGGSRRSRPSTVAHLVEVDGERAPGGDLRVELAQRAGGRVARVDVGLLAGRLALLVHAS